MCIFCEQQARLNKPDTKIYYSHTEHISDVNPVRKLFMSWIFYLVTWRWEVSWLVWDYGKELKHECWDERIHPHKIVSVAFMWVCQNASPSNKTKLLGWDGMNSYKSYIVWNDIICTELQRKINNMHTIAFELSLHACFTIWFSFIMNVTMIIKMIKQRLNSFT